MLRALLLRTLSLALTLLGVAAALFWLLDVLPGDPAAIMLGTAAREDTLAALRAQLGLDRPAPARFLGWLAGLAVGDFGQSITYATPVGPLVAERLAVTLPLAAVALALAIAIALPLGTLAAARTGRLADGVIGTVSRVGIAVPNFWLGLLLVLVFATGLGWLPAGGFPGWSAGIGPAGRSLVLPALALALPQAAVLTRITRAAVLEVMRADFVRTARAKGRSPRGALLLHALPNALVPITTIIGLQLSVLIAGAILVENVFNLPGLGRLAYQALVQRDLVVIRTVVLLFAAIVIGVNALVDALALVLDPRLRAGR